MVDNLDVKILNILQERGREKRSDIATAIGMSIPSISERMYKMEGKGIIEGYYAKVNKSKFNYDIMAFILVNMDSSKHYKTLAQKVEKNPNILECHSILGEGSHMMKAIVKNTTELEQLLTEIQSWPDVTNTRTYFVLSTIKETTKIPL
jgi:Lrp/AsnC family leucine-responsive transcriptional regulator